MKNRLHALETAATACAPGSVCIGRTQTPCARPACADQVVERSVISVTASTVAAVIPTCHVCSRARSILVQSQLGTTLRELRVFWQR
jgi:hypothetical protein